MSETGVIGAPYPAPVACGNGCKGHFESDIVYRGGCHHVVCPGDGKHYWYFNDGTECVRDVRPCAEWRGGCPAKGAKEH